MSSNPSREQGPRTEAALSLTEREIFRNRNGRIYAMLTADDSAGVVCDMWFGGFDREVEFKAVIEAVLSCLETGGFDLWLADLRYLSHSFETSQTWLIENVVPRAIATGLRREAVVLPDSTGLPASYDVFGATNRMIQKLADGRIRGFTDIEMAKKWLLTGERP